MKPNVGDSVGPDGWIPFTVKDEGNITAEEKEILIERWTHEGLQQAHKLLIKQEYVRQRYEREPPDDERADLLPEHHREFAEGLFALRYPYYKEGCDDRPLD